MSKRIVLPSNLPGYVESERPSPHGLETDYTVRLDDGRTIEVPAGSCRAPFGELPSRAEVECIHVWTFSGCAKGAIGLPSTRTERVIFVAPAHEAQDAAWKALLASGAYERGEHYSPALRTNLGRRTDALSRACEGALACAREFRADGTSPTIEDAIRTMELFYPQKLTALELAHIELALREAEEASRA